MCRKAKCDTCGKQPKKLRPLPPESLPFSSQIRFSLRRMLTICIFCPQARRHGRAAGTTSRRRSPASPRRTSARANPRSRSADRSILLKRSDDHAHLAVALAGGNGETSRIQGKSPASEGAPNGMRTSLYIYRWLVTTDNFLNQKLLFQQ